jgi:hypothetical protein
VRRRAAIDLLLLCSTVLGLILVAVAVAGGGLSSSLAGVRLSSRTAFRPALLAVASTLVAASLFPRRRHQLSRLWAFARRHVAAIAAILTIATFAGGIRYGTFEAAAADQYGYVSQAHLWAGGTLQISQPLATIAPWPDADWTLSPLGYRPGQQPGTIVPIYAPGLPLVMAGFSRVFGQTAVYVPVALFGAMAVGLTFLLARHISDGVSGLIAIMLVLSSPTFLFHLRDTMSDVPVTAWSLLAIVLAVRGTALSALGSGLAASGVVLTRPNLVPVITCFAITAAFVGSWRPEIRLRRLALFAIGVIPGCAAVAMIHTHLYGSPLVSGYGSASTIFRAEYLPANLSRYPRWLIQTETPLICLGMIAPWLFNTQPRKRLLAILFLATVLVLFACYAFYLPFENWTYLRFLLPAIALLLILTGVALVDSARRLSSSTARGLCAALFCLLVAWRFDTAVSHGFQVTRPDDRRFEMVGSYVHNELPEEAIIFAMMHSGSVRHYSGRTTIRWDSMPPEWLDRSLDFLRAQGYRPYFAIDDFEREQFQARFANHSALAALDWPPVATLPQRTATNLYDPADRDRFFAGDTVRTMTITPAGRRSE